MGEELSWKAGIAIALVVLVVVVGLSGLLAATWGRAECDASTAGLSIAHTWSFLGGCRVEAKPGVWVPLRNYRWFDD
jgi:hypothetical protein